MCVDGSAVLSPSTHLPEWGDEYSFRASICMSGSGAFEFHQPIFVNGGGMLIALTILHEWIWEIVIPSINPHEWKWGGHPMHATA